VVSTTLVVFSFGLFQIIQGIYIGVGNPGTASWFDAFRSVLTTLSQVGFLTFFGWGSFGLIAGFSTAAIVTSFSIWVVSRIRPAVPSMRTLRRTYSFARWSIPDSLIGNVYSRLDVLLLGVIVGSEAVGYYETALRLVQPAALFASSISSPLLVKTSGLSSLDRDVLPDLNNAFSYTALIASPIFFGTLALPKSLMSIFSPEFASGGQLLIGLGLLQIFRTLASPLNSIINATDNPHIEFRISIVVTCLNLVAAVILGYQIGAIGVVGAAVVAEAIRFGSYQLFMRHNFAQIVFTKFVTIEILSGFIMFMPIYFLAPFLQPQTNPISLAGLILLGATVYFGLLIVLTDEFRTTVKSIIEPFYTTIVNK
jgi:O-antigen/teichoic acid export membrane protein